MSIELKVEMSALFKSRLCDVRLLSLDVDGVLTDGGIYIGDNGSQFRKFNVKDGMGMQRVRDAGIEVAIISAGHCAAVEQRASMLGIVHTRTGVTDKLSELRDICALVGTSLSSVAHIGDDVNDIPVMQAVGCPISVADAVAEAREAAIYVTNRRGGDAAVREICDLLLALRQL